MNKIKKSISIFLIVFFLTFTFSNYQNKASAFVPVASSGYEITQIALGLLIASGIIVAGAPMAWDLGSRLAHKLDSLNFFEVDSFGNKILRMSESVRDVVDDFVKNDIPSIPTSSEFYISTLNDYTSNVDPVSMTKRFDKLTAAYEIGLLGIYNISPGAYSLEATFKIESSYGGSYVVTLPFSGFCYDGSIGTKLFFSKDGFRIYIEDGNGYSNLVSKSNSDVGLIFDTGVDITFSILSVEVFQNENIDIIVPYSYDNVSSYDINKLKNKILDDQVVSSQDLSLPISLDIDYVTPSISDVILVDGSIPSDTPSDTPVDTPFDFTVPSELPISLDFSPLIIDLKTKFPFCIPFDLAKSIESLSVVPVAPKWEVQFSSIYFKSQSTLVLDFNQFESLAKIVRWGILISFSFGLMILTKKIIN